MRLLETDCLAIRRVLADYVSQRIHLTGSTSSILEMIERAEHGTPVELTRDQALDLGMIIAMLEARYADYDEIDDVDRDKYDYFRRLDNEGIDVSLCWSNHEYPHLRNIDYYIEVSRIEHIFELVRRAVCAGNNCRALMVMSMLERIYREVPNISSVILDDDIFDILVLISSSNSPGPFPHTVGEAIRDVGKKMPVEFRPAVTAERAEKLISSLPLNRCRWNEYFRQHGINVIEYDACLLANKIAMLWKQQKVPYSIAINELYCRRLGLSDEEIDGILGA